MHDVIFESDTPAGWAFDVGLLIAILCSITVISLETIPSIARRELAVLESIEWCLTILFTVEYFARLACARHPLRYAFSFWGIVDLLSILPTYIGYVFVPQTQTRSFVILRSIRLLRAFRVLKLWRMMSDADELWHAVWNARHKIIVFLIVVMVAVTISGTLMYFVETIMPALVAGVPPQDFDSRFDSIPQAMYWAIVTMTTVGYGDIVPTTTTGKVISATLILLGYSLIIVPSGFVTAELTSHASDKEDAGDKKDLDATTTDRPCPRCETQKHLTGAVYCHRCGERLG
ncbi:potassium channel protein [Rhodopirellula sp. MGV]|nr:potassium channel protein [Rhodopirellula sp. MGV]PNY37161.1 ion transporter [Rhodopirellula baltica]